MLHRPELYEESPHSWTPLEHQSDLQEHQGPLEKDILITFTDTEHTIESIDQLRITLYSISSMFLRCFPAEHKRHRLMEYTLRPPNLIAMPVSFQLMSGTRPIGFGDTLSTIDLDYMAFAT